MSEQIHNYLSHLGFHRETPCELLREYIHSYWFINAYGEKNKVYNEFLHPDGGFGIVFNYGDALSFNDEINTNHFYFDGTNTTSVRLDLSGKISAVGIRFKPAGAYVFFNVPLSEIKNDNVSLSDAKLHWALRLGDELHGYQNCGEKVRAIDKTLLNALMSNRKISHLISRSRKIIIQHKGILPINALTEKLSVSQRKLERIFVAQMGMSPYEYSRNIRVEQARMALKAEKNSFSDIVFKLGYYDQAHFNRSFKSVVGVTPGAYRQRNNRK